MPWISDKFVLDKFSYKMRNKMSSNVNIMKARNLKRNIFYFLRRILQWRRIGSGRGSMEASLACDSPSLLGSWRAVWKSHEKNTSFLWCEVRKVFPEWMNYLHRMNLEIACVSKPDPLEFFWLHFWSSYVSIQGLCKETSWNQNEPKA